MPQYEKYEGESQEAADARISENIKNASIESKIGETWGNPETEEAVPDKTSTLGESLTKPNWNSDTSEIDEIASMGRRNTRTVMDRSPENLTKLYFDNNSPIRKNADGEVVHTSEQDVKELYELGGWSGPRQSGDTYRRTLSGRSWGINELLRLRDNGEPLKDVGEMLDRDTSWDEETFDGIIKNMDKDTQMGEIISWDDGRDEVGLYAVRVPRGKGTHKYYDVKFVQGSTDRYYGYGKSGNPKYKSSADAKYGSAKNQVKDGQFVSGNEAFKIYLREAKRAKPGMTEKVMKSISNYMGGDE